MDYQKVYNALISFRKSNPLKKSKKLYTELHHIVPRCLGGTDEPENLVRLTAREHFIAHRLLAKIHADNSDLALAVLFMAGNQRRDICSSREIERLRHLSSKRKSERAKRQWRDTTFRERMVGLWGTEEFIEKMQTARRGTISALWKDPEFRKKMETLWRSARHKELLVSGQERYLKHNPWPWQRQSAQRTRHIWTLAATFWELSKFNPRNAGKGYSREKFSDEFCGGSFERIFQRMMAMFKEGWIPQECPAYLEEFGDKM